MLRRAPIKPGRKAVACAAVLVGLCTSISLADQYTLMLPSDVLAPESGPGLMTQMSTSSELVPVGTFNTEAEAWCYARAVQIGGKSEPAEVKKIEGGTASVGDLSQVPLADSFELSLEQDALGDPSLLTQVLQRNGALPETAPSDVLLAKETSQLSKEELLAVGRSAPRNIEGVPALQEFLTRHPDDPQANQVRLRLARRLLGRRDFEGIANALQPVSVGGQPEEKILSDWISGYAEHLQGNEADAAMKFRAVAKNQSAPIAVRLDASRRLAGCLHIEHDYPAAWLAFEDIAEDSPSPAERAEAKMQIAGLAFEIKKLYSVGTWEEIRQLCAEASSMPGIARRDLATAELMRCETFFEEGQYTTALSELQAFVTSFDDVRRESSMARLWIGISQVRLGDIDGAELALQQVAALELGGDEIFRGEDPRAGALVWLISIASKQNDLAAAETHFAALESDFPESPEHRRAQTFMTKMRRTAAP